MASPQIEKGNPGLTLPPDSYMLSPAAECAQAVTECDGPHEVSGEGGSALVHGVSQPSGSASGSSRPDSALEVLKRRYARGEINKGEYEEKKKDLV